MIEQVWLNIVQGSHSPYLISPISKNREETIKELRDMFVHVNIWYRIQKQDLGKTVLEENATFQLLITFTESAHKYRNEYTIHTRHTQISKVIFILQCFANEGQGQNHVLSITGHFSCKHYFFTHETKNWRAQPSLVQILLLRRKMKLSMSK